MEVGGNTADMFEDETVRMTCSLEAEKIQRYNLLLTQLLLCTSHCQSFARPFHQLIGFLRCSCRRLAVAPCTLSGSGFCLYKTLCRDASTAISSCVLMYVYIYIYVHVAKNLLQHRTNSRHVLFFCHLLGASASPPSSSICTLALISIHFSSDSSALSVHISWYHGHDL